MNLKVKYRVFIGSKVNGFVTAQFGANNPNELSAAELLVICKDSGLFQTKRKKGLMIKRIVESVVPKFYAQSKNHNKQNQLPLNTTDNAQSKHQNKRKQRNSVTSTDKLQHHHQNKLISKYNYCIVFIVISIVVTLYYCILFIVIFLLLLDCMQQQ